jgi:hypothetical protein
MSSSGRFAAAAVSVLLGGGAFAAQPSFAHVSTTTVSAAAFSYDAHGMVSANARAFHGVEAWTTQFGDVRVGSATPSAMSRRTSTTSTPFTLSNATEAAGLTDEAAGLLGNADDVVVLGRQADTAVAKGWDGHVVLDTPNWSLELNDAFIRGAIDQGRTIYLASPTTGNLVQTAGQFAGQPTIYARELNMLREAGYVRVGDYMVPG